MERLARAEGREGGVPGQRLMVQYVGDMCREQPHELPQL